MIERFDSFLIDRGFQPISDRLAGWASCYAISGFLITGATLAEIAALLRLEAWAALAIVAPWFAFQAWRAHRMESAPASNVLPKERIVSRFTRVFYIALSITNAPVTVALAMQGHPIWIMRDAGGWLLILGLYFLACRRNPPKPRAVRLPLSTATLST